MYLLCIDRMHSIDYVFVLGNVMVGSNIGFQSWLLVNTVVIKYFI